MKDRYTVGSLNCLLDLKYYLLKLQENIEKRLKSDELDYTEWNSVFEFERLRGKMEMIYEVLNYIETKIKFIKGDKNE